MLGRIGRDVGGGRASYNRELGEGERQREGDADITSDVIGKTYVRPGRF